MKTQHEKQRIQGLLKIDKGELIKLLIESEDEVESLGEEVHDLKWSAREQEDDHEYEMDSLKEEMEEKPYDNVLDQMKYDFFIDNFDKITQANLELLLK